MKSALIPVPLDNIRRGRGLDDVSSQECDESDLDFRFCFGGGVDWANAHENRCGNRGDSLLVNLLRFKTRPSNLAYNYRAGDF